MLGKSILMTMMMHMITGKIIDTCFWLAIGRAFYLTIEVVDVDIVLMFA